MSMSVVNCRRCKRVFQKRLSELCPECIILEDEQFSLVYKALQHEGPVGVAIDALAQTLRIPENDIEQMYLSGRLGTAGTYLRFKCQICDMMMNGSQRCGRLCKHCNEATATQAGVKVYSRQQLDQNEAREKTRIEQISMLKNNKASASRIFGRH